MMPPEPEGQEVVVDLTVYCYACDKQYEVRAKTGEPWHNLCPASPGYTGSTGTLGQEGHRTATLNIAVVAEEEAAEWEKTRYDDDMGIDYSNRR